MPSKQDIIREGIAELEHEQWMQWSKSIADNTREFYIDKPKLVKWMECWKPYDQLTEEQKDQDRKWADKVLELEDKLGVVIKVANQHDLIYILKIL